MLLAAEAAHDEREEELVTSKHDSRSLGGSRTRRVGYVMAVFALVGSAIVLGGYSSGSSGQASAARAKGALSKVQSGEMLEGSGKVIPIVLQRDDQSGVTGTITGRPDWPRYSPSYLEISKGKQVTLLIVNYDDMTTPLTSALSTYDNVQGGSETVNGQTVSSVSNDTIAHTFTIPDLGINVPVPAATDQGTGTAKIVVPAVVTFTFTPAKSGTFTWHCYTPCGTGSNGTGGPMAKKGWMEGTLRVVK